MITMPHPPAYGDFALDYTLYWQVYPVGLGQNWPVRGGGLQKIVSMEQKSTDLELSGRSKGVIPSMIQGT